MNARLITLSILTLLLAAITHAAFNLPEEITVSGRIDPDGTLRTDVVRDGAETETPISTLIFSENFDAQPDWATTDRFTAIAPAGWDHASTSEAWHPTTSPGTQPTMQISGADMDKVHGSTGKAFVFYNESYDANNWNSDGMIFKDIPATRSIYVKFNIKFQPGFAGTGNIGQVKIFRLMHFDGGQRTAFFENGNSAPMYIYDWAQSSYGVRHFHSFRCDDQATNYFCPNLTIGPRPFVSGSISTNYTDNVANLTQSIPDLVNGGFIPGSGTVWHDQVLGGVWHTLEFYAELNSVAGIANGKFKHWIDGQKILDLAQVPWVATTGDIDATFNSFAIGGNNFYKFDLTSAPALRERWYAIDNIEVSTTLPQNRQ